MSWEPDAVGPEASGDAEVIASVETGPSDKFILADITRDGAFLTVPLEDAASLPEWR